MISGIHALSPTLLSIASVLYDEQVPVSWVHPNCQPSTHTITTWISGKRDAHSEGGAIVKYNNFVVVTVYFIIILHFGQCT